MIILTRRPGETLTFGPGQEVTLTVLAVAHGQVRLGLGQPGEPQSADGELWKEIQNVCRAQLHKPPDPPPAAPEPPAA